MVMVVLTAGFLLYFLLKPPVLHDHEDVEEKVLAYISSSDEVSPVKDVKQT